MKCITKIYYYNTMLTLISVFQLFSSQNTVLSLVDISKKTAFQSMKILMKSDPSRALQKIQTVPGDIALNFIHSCCVDGFQSPRLLSAFITASLQCYERKDDRTGYERLAVLLSGMNVFSSGVICNYVLNAHESSFLKFLVHEGIVNIDFTFSDGQTLLHRATEVGNMTMIAALIDDLAFNVNVRDGSKYIALHFAPTLEIARKLVAAGSDIRAQGDIRKDIPWQSASLAGRHSVADYLKGLLDYQ